MMMTKQRTHLHIVSLPRSGSTVLANLLGKRSDVLVLPETFFPAVLDHLRDADMVRKRYVAGLFVASCSDGSPLTLAEAEACVTRDRRETMERIARAVAEKYGREPAAIGVVVWKFTRMVGSWRFVASQGDRFLILQRPLENVYESQFRVDFGRKNRNPLRFALFAASYQVAFRDYPPAQTRTVEYGRIPAELEMLWQWMGAVGDLDEGQGSPLQEISATKAWHTDVGSGFVDRDVEKRRNLSAWQGAVVEWGTRVMAALPFLAMLARRVADDRQFRVLVRRAEQLAEEGEAGKT